MVYAVALTTATHWALVLAPVVPTTDKTIHLASFAGLTVLLWQTRWLRRRTAVLLVTVAWAVLDETSQGIPALRRWVTREDGAANVLGAVLAATWLWALRPLGSAGNRLRLDRRRYLFEEAFARGRLWAALVAVMIVVLGAGALAWPHLDGRAWPLVVLAFAGGISSKIVAFAAVRAERRRLEDDRPCFACGRPADDAPSRCAGCGGPLVPGQWRAPAPPPSRDLLAAAARAGAIGAMALAIVFALILASAPLYEAIVTRSPESAGSAATAVHLIVTTTRGLGTTVDVALLGILLAVVIRLFRGSLARTWDQAVRCRRCGHDLRGTPADERGVGRCGECGELFGRRIDDGPAVAASGPRDD
ncbi:MAG: hypothetical protein ACYTG1_07675 [Planctomycetota bacterium]